MAEPDKMVKMLVLPRDFEGARDILARRIDIQNQPASGDLGLRQGATLAAVLLPLVWHDGAPSLLFTRRTEQLSTHPGQISFPGGRMESGESPEQAALRETYEECGIEPARVSLLGRLAPYATVSGFWVTPVVGMLEPGFVLKLQASEVAEVFEVPLAYIMDARNHYQRSLPLPNALDARVQVHAIDWQGRTIWGATAGMLMTLYRTLLEKE